MRSQKRENLGIPTLRNYQKIYVIVKQNAEALNQQFSVFTREGLTKPLLGKGQSPYQLVGDITIRENGVLNQLKNLMSTRPVDLMKFLQECFETMPRRLVNTLCNSNTTWGHFHKTGSEPE